MNLSSSASIDLMMSSSRWLDAVEGGSARTASAMGRRQQFDYNRKSPAPKWLQGP
jgi:hypothetical protein